jgi:nucleotide-binding universal stress UspA family protein
MIGKILLGYDGSAASQKALDAALNLARQYRAALVILTVVQPPEFGEDVETEAVIENSRSHHEKLLAAVKPMVDESGVRANYEIAVGHPAEQIIYHADRHDADLIVVGDRGRSKFTRLLLGSVSKHVVQYADRQVLVVR